MVADYTIIFDGGSIGNPGPGYGSFAISAAGQTKPQIVRLQFGGVVSSNEAEYDTLVAALEHLIATLRQAGREPCDCTVEIRGDSRLVMEQLSGQWKAHNGRMKARRDWTLALLAQFRGFTLIQQPREQSVKLLGH